MVWNSAEQSLLAETGITCICGDEIQIAEEIFEARVVQTQITSTGVIYHDVLNEYGGYKYNPLYLEFDCWEQLQEDLETQQEDLPPSEDQLGVISCDICKSDIREWEIMTLIKFGELHVSQRSPHGVSLEFESMGDDKHICIGCLYKADDSLGWGDIECLPEVSVCVEGIYERCWRQNCCLQNCKNQT